MAELVVSDDTSQLVLECDLCRLDSETVRGVIVCVDRMECLCSTCSEIYLNNEVFKGHNTVTKDTLPVNFTSQTLHELKDMIFCVIHEVQFEYYCEDHAQFVCQPCTKNAHRCCKRITKLQNVQLSPQSVLSEIQEMKKWFQEVTKQRQELKELESAETKRQIQLKTIILAKIQAFSDQGRSKNKQDDKEDDTEAVDLLCDGVKKVIRLQDRHEELLRAVLHLNDTERTMAVSRRVALSLDISSMKQTIESSIGRMDTVKKIADRLEILEAILDELVSVSHCEGKDKLFKHITHILGVTTCIRVDAEMQTDVCQETKEEHLQQVCETEPSTESLDCLTNPQANLWVKHTYKDVEVQTDDVSETRSTTRQYICTTEHLTASADVDTEPDDVTGPCTSQQSDNSSLAHGSTDPDIVDVNCQTPDCTKQRDTTIPLLQSRLEYIGEFNVCSEGEKHCDIEGIVVLKYKRVALIDSKNNKLKIYDRSFNFQISYQLKWRPVDICVADLILINRVAISFNSRRVETYDVNEDNICYVRGFHLSLNCRGICSMSRNTIAVLVSDVESMNKSGVFPDTNSNEDDIEIQIRDINNGRKIRSIDTFDRKVRNPTHILQDNQNNIIIGEQNQLSAFDRDGDRVWFYKTLRESKLEMGMTMDPEGNIYVCSHSSNSIHQVSSFNYRNNRVIIPHVPGPNCVAYDPHQERLIVGGYQSKCVNVFNSSRNISMKCLRSF